MIDRKKSDANSFQDKTKANRVPSAVEGVPRSHMGAI